MFISSQEGVNFMLRHSVPQALFYFWKIVYVRKSTPHLPKKGNENNFNNLIPNNEDWTYNHYAAM